MSKFQNCFMVSMVVFKTREQLLQYHVIVSLQMYLSRLKWKELIEKSLHIGIADYLVRVQA